MADTVPIVASPLSLDCDICCEPFHHTSDERRPRVLSCGHSFCGDCLEQLMIPQQGICCPTCRFITRVAESKEVKVNFGLEEYIKFIEAHPALKKSSGAAIVDSCATCEQPAVWYCLEDEAPLCDQHKDQTHLLPIQKKHHICPIAEKLKHLNAKLPMCAKHQAPKLLWCTKCKVLCCSTCSSHGVHKGHESKLIDDEVQTAKDWIQTFHKGAQFSQDVIQIVTSQLLDADKQIQHDLEEETLMVDIVYGNLLENIVRIRDQLKQDLAIQVQAARKQVDLRLQDISMIRSQISMVAQKTIACLDLPDHELLECIPRVEQDCETWTQDVIRFGQDDKICIGVKVKGLDAVKVMGDPIPTIALEMGSTSSIPLRKPDEGALEERKDAEQSGQPVRGEPKTFDGTMVDFLGLSAEERLLVNVLKLESVKPFGVDAICDTIKQSRNLTTLDLPNVLVSRAAGEVSKHQANSIGDVGAVLLAAAIKESRSMTKLSLVDHGIGRNGALALADAIKESKSMTHLNLANNEIGANGALALADAIKSSKRMDVLNLEKNMISLASMFAIHSAVEVTNSKIHQVLRL